VIIRLLAVLFFCVAAFGQQITNLAGYTANRSTTGTSEKVTIQQPASGSRRIRLISAYVYCSAGCDVDQSRDGTAATSTSLAVSKLNPTDAGPSAATAWYSSNVGAGTAIGPTVTLQAGVGQAMDLNGIYLNGDGTGINYTLAVSSGTSGTIRISIKWVAE
jgi:hypothetical protein